MTCEPMLEHPTDRAVTRTNVVVVAQMSVLLMPLRPSPARGLIPPPATVVFPGLSHNRVSGPRPHSAVSEPPQGQGEEPLSTRDRTVKNVRSVMHE